MKLIYCAHKYGNNPNNQTLCESLIKRLVKKYPQYVFLSPLSATGFLYNEVTYNTGIEMCLEILSRCDEIWILSEDSKGVKIERGFAERNNIKVREVFSVPELYY